MDIKDMETFIDRIRNEEVKISHLVDRKQDITKDKNRANDIYI
jgi:hypothetical protein